MANQGDEDKADIEIEWAYSGKSHQGQAHAI